MRISIIIVNYNVRHFLEQCLNSVEKALSLTTGEIIVVDNASIDDSVQMVRQQFPRVKLIASEKNLGFSKANNLGASQAHGDYILILNPDTIVEEECFLKCLQFMDSHKDAGAVGVRMLDGAGHFLPESKRGFPGMWNSFCKMSGLYKLFPNSAVFNGYYRGDLPENETTPIEVLSGAFMFIRRSIYMDVGGFDERYFMYGEDIDLSCRLTARGYINYYFPETTILHFKGESTRKASIHYVNSFYQAMIIFSTQHLSGGSKKIFIALLKIVIWIKAILSAIKQFAASLRWMVPDMIFLGLGFYLIKQYWAIIYHQQPGYFDNIPTLINLISFIAMWVLSFYYHGVYEKAYSLRNIAMASIWGLFINLMLYALLPESWRASRMLLLLSFLWVIVYAIVSRLLYNKLLQKQWIVGSHLLRNCLVIGDTSQFERARFLFNEKQLYEKITQKDPSSKPVYSKQQWLDFFRIQHIHEVILCEKNMTWSAILDFISQYKGVVQFKILPASGNSIVGSSRKSSPGDIYSLELDFHLGQLVYLRQKRLFDILFAILLMTFGWILIFIWKDKKSIVKNWWKVLLGNRTWVSYQGMELEGFNLPIIKPGVIKPVSKEHFRYPPEWVAQIVQHYAWGYTVWQDLAICLKEFQSLDQHIDHGSKRQD